MQANDQNFTADRRLRAVLFDVDGTLVDSIPFLVECFQATTRNILGREVSSGTILPLVGRPLAEMFRKVEPDLREEVLHQCVLGYRSIYRPEVLNRSPLFPGAGEVIEELRGRGFALGIVSGKTAEGVRRVLRPAGILDAFTALVGADHGCPGKPAPDGALAAAAMLGVAPEETIVVGDSLLDIEMGAAAGMATCGVATGTARREELASRADAVIDALSELPELL